MCFKSVWVASSSLRPAMSDSACLLLHGLSAACLLLHWLSAACLLLHWLSSEAGNSCLCVRSACNKPMLLWMLSSTVLKLCAPQHTCNNHGDDAAAPRPSSCADAELCTTYHCSPSVHATSTCKHMQCVTAWLHHKAPGLLFFCRMLLSRQFHPRIGALAAVNINRRHVDLSNPLQEPLLLSHQSGVPPTPQVSAVAGQRLLSAMDMLKPILAESPEKDPEHSLRHSIATATPGNSRLSSRRPSETGTLSHMV